MKIKRKGIISVALIIAMILSIGTLFISCANSEAEESIKVHMKIASDIHEECEDMDLMVTGIKSELTVLTATQRMIVDVMGLKFEYDKELDAVKKIGSKIGELFESEYETEAPADEEPAAVDEEPAENEDEDATEAEDIVKDFYYDWVCTVNGTEATISDTIKDGDSIVWEWKQVKKELIEKKK